MVPPGGGGDRRERLRAADGRLCEYRTCADILDGLTQLGAVSGPNGPARP
ncbi:hypothetical protein [Streptomyces buecherae]|uniref:Uncharacterized protein n=1 Tax=Streptomyces buecherae TaxID=2763006 RepID=A0A7H8NFM2_9ACTN|nr:hypothetical protein [Streptomyces buecherae]QKW53279.1 hypothetical protein HUT08_31255 [Streptomyces buecherae]